tara:strand:- start:1333 stop:1533 length:201 start_codon:yes stop_codon:yes gene_type:complete
MIAVIEFEIEDEDESEETKQKLIQHISYQLQEWLNGDGIINIKFITDDENNSNYSKINWITDNSIN